jgi:hypothetical protein
VSDIAKTDDVVDEGVVEQVQPLDALQQLAAVMVSVFQKSGIDLHLAQQDGLQVLRDVVAGGNLLVAGG